MDCRTLPELSLRRRISGVLTMQGITVDEYRHRLGALQSSVVQADLDLFIVSALDSLYYLTGAGFEPFERPFFLLVRPEHPPVLLVPKLEHEHMRRAQNIPDESIQTYWDYPAPSGRSWPDRLRELIEGSRQVGVEPTLPLEISQELRDFSLQAEPLVERLRSVKSSNEIGLIRRAAHYADLSVERLLAASYYGSTVAEGFAETRVVTSRIIREVADWEPLSTKVTMATWPAPESAMPHSVPNLNSRLLEGPHVALALTRINGYAAETERTYFTAPPSSEVARTFAAMMEARRIAFEMIRPGVRCAELDATINEFLRREGYYTEDQRLHRIGHGLGLGSHESPWLSEGSEDCLSENMVISIEPGIYLAEIGGVRHSDTVLVTEDGYELLTTYPTDMEPLIIRGWRPLPRFRGWLVQHAFRLKQSGRGSAQSLHQEM